ncbi:MAG: PilZ domain-containing protein [Deltaproteobacteria bacterium]|jgi:Tfp pilus assembly protein PilZ
MSLQDPSITHELFKMVAKMSDDERRTLLNLLQNGLLKGRCRRRHYRKSLRLPVHYLSQGRTYSGYTQNISLGGLFLPTRYRFTVGQGLVVAFPPRNSNKYIKMVGEVVRLDPEGIGIKFKSMTQKEKTALLTLASPS